MFAAFGLYWDSYACLVMNTNLLSTAYRIGDAFPLGNVFVLITTFSLFAAVISPVIFWLANHVFWAIWAILPLPLKWKFDDEFFVNHIQDFVPLWKLKIWAIKEKNAQAMAVVHDEEQAETESVKSRPLPFLLGLCVGINYFFAGNSLLTTIERNLPILLQGRFVYVVVTFICYLAFASFNGVRERRGYVYMPGFNKYMTKVHTSNHRADDTVTHAS